MLKKIMNTVKNFKDISMLLVKRGAKNIKSNLASSFIIIGLAMALGLYHNNATATMDKLEENVNILGSEFEELKSSHIKQIDINTELEEVNTELSNGLEATRENLESTKEEMAELQSSLQKVTSERDELKKTWASRQASRKTNTTSGSTSSSSSNSIDTSGSGWMSFRASAYSTRANGDPYGGAYGNLTATGTYNQEGRTIAVDPNVIPLGSKVEVSFPSGWEHMNGVYIAENTGSAIKGNIIDVYMDNYQRCLNFGRRQVKVRRI